MNCSLLEIQERCAGLWEQGLPSPQVRSLGILESRLIQPSPKRKHKTLMCLFLNTPGYEATHLLDLLLWFLLVELVRSEPWEGVGSSINVRCSVK